MPHASLYCHLLQQQSWLCCTVWQRKKIAQRKSD